MSEDNIKPQTAGGSKKKLWYIVGGVLVLIILGRLLSGSIANNGATTALEQTTYKTDNGTVTVGGNSLPSNWPSDVPQYPGAKIQYSGSSNPQTGEAGVSVVFEVNAAAQTVVDFYKRELASKGWKIDSTATMGSATIIGASKGGKIFSVSVVDSGNGTVSVTVVISGV